MNTSLAVVKSGTRLTKPSTRLPNAIADSLTSGEFRPPFIALASGSGSPPVISPPEQPHESCLPVSPAHMRLPPSSTPPLSVFVSRPTPVYTRPSTSPKSNPSCPVLCALRPNPLHPPRTIRDVKSDGSWPPVHGVEVSNTSWIGLAAVRRSVRGFLAPPSRTSPLSMPSLPPVLPRLPLCRRVATLEGGGGVRTQSAGPRSLLLVLLSFLFHRCAELTRGWSPHTCRWLSDTGSTIRTARRQQEGARVLSVLVSPRAPSRIVLLRTTYVQSSKISSQVRLVLTSSYSFLLSWIPGFPSAARTCESPTLWSLGHLWLRHHTESTPSPRLRSSGQCVSRYRVLLVPARVLFSRD
ncbi:uncharacterized protein V3H82_025692 [Fundulus diaphanus]